MKRMTLLLLTFVFGFTFAVIAQQQDLGELAKKEKARREALEKSGKKAKVLTNEDVDELKTEISTVTGETTTEEPVSTDESGEYVPPQDSEPVPTNPDAERQKQLQELEAQKDAARNEAETARSTVGSGGLYHTRNTGTQYQKAREAEKKLEELDKKITDLEKKEKPSESQAETVKPQTPPNERPPDEVPAEEPPAEEPPLQ